MTSDDSREAGGTLTGRGDASPATHDPAGARLAAHRAEATVLVITADEALREAASVLGSQGWRVLFAGGESDAGETMARSALDLVFLDAAACDASPAEEPAAHARAIRRLRGAASNARVPIVFVSDTPDRDARSRALDAGADELLARPIDAVELAARARTMMRLGGYRRQLTEQLASQERILRQVRRLGVLRAVDTAVTANLDLPAIFNVLLIQLTLEAGVEAAVVRTLNPVTGELEYAAGRGFRSDAITTRRMRLEPGPAGLAALDRLMRQADAGGAGSHGADFMGAEGFTSHAVVPLVAGGEPKGVLEIFHRAQFSPDPEWPDFMGALGGTIAMAIENADLLRSLRRATRELEQAYDATLEGWVRALDLHDKETEGHTQRVTRASLRLSELLGVPRSDLVHIRRGALLHDIGKMGIPDRILQKPGPLTPDEWAVMRRHPSYAFDMLSPIDFLRPSLDIPYCHHERWDGTGYPRGLKSYDIPLPARVFAVVDVWDAMGSPRCYHAGLPQEEVQRHIRASAGTHFDPAVADAFLRVIDELRDGSMRPASALPLAS